MKIIITVLMERCWNPQNWQCFRGKKFCSRVNGSRNFRISKFPLQDCKEQLLWLKKITKNNTLIKLITGQFQLQTRWVVSFYYEYWLYGGFILVKTAISVTCYSPCDIRSTVIGWAWWICFARTPWEHKVPPSCWRSLSLRSRLWQTGNPPLQTAQPGTLKTDEKSSQMRTAIISCCHKMSRHVNKASMERCNFFHLHLCFYIVNICIGHCLYSMSFPKHCISPSTFSLNNWNIFPDVTDL